MAKQLPIYETAVPLSAARHGNVSLDATGDYLFGAGINVVPLMATEFARAATETAIVVAGVGDDGKPSDYTQNVLNFLQDCHAHFERATLFGRRSKDRCDGRRACRIHRCSHVSPACP